MSSEAETLIRSGMAQGLSLETILDAVSSLIEARQGSSVRAPVSVSTTDETKDWCERSFEGKPDAAIPEAPEPAPPAAELSELERYEDLGQIGMGGMGVVHRVFDRRLGRTVALKVIRPSAQHHPELVARFFEEAQTTAQLQHPGIVPIHDLGSLSDGRVWFTMKEVAGQTFGAVIAEAHRARHQAEVSGSGDWGLRRLVEILQQVCEAVGYAHGRGVVHRDLKPGNVMVGAYGEVLVLDWGLVKVLGQLETTTGTVGHTVQTDRSRDGDHPTMVGAVAGTPAYMPPEQALGWTKQIDARSDVYALGAVLYKVLSGHAPYAGGDATEVLNKVRSGPPVSVRTAIGRRAPGASHQGWRPQVQSAAAGLLPAQLVAACERAMARLQADRFGSASELGAELQAWLDGSRRRDEGRAVVARATQKAPEATALRARAAALRGEAAALLDGIEPWRPDEHKRPGWMKADEAAALERQAERQTLEMEQLLQGALTHAPELPEAHAALASQYRAAHEAAEAAREDTTRAETLLRHHASALPTGHPDRAMHLTWLRGDGALTLVTDPPGAEVLLHRYVLEHRRLVPRFERSLGPTPLRTVSLPMGSYLCILRHPDRDDVRYPVSIGRGEHWHGVPPEGGDPHAIPLPRVGALGAEDCYVPAGWFRCGGDPHQERSLSARRVWVDGHVFRRFPVTNRAYIAFLDSLVASGRADEALRYVPREKAGAAGEQGAAIYGFDGRCFSLRADADGDLWQPDWPVCMVDWHGARAYAAMESARTGHQWRLPGDYAWEKAARGVDGRFYPWGDGFDPSWTSMRLSHQGRMRPTPVGRFPVDESPYGVRDLAGSMQDWCEDCFVEEGAPLAAARHGGSLGQESAPLDGPPGRRAIRGGSWYFAAGILRLCLRNGLMPTYRHSSLGFRLARFYAAD